MAQKNITVSFPIPVSEKGRIKANDAKKLLKHLAVSNLLKVGTDYFVTDSTGHEEMWTFQKSMDWEHDYEFSCEVFDDDRDFYNCLYFDKKSGKIDYKSCEYEAHLVECAKREEKMNEYIEDQPSREDIFNYLDAIEQSCSKEELIQSLKNDWGLSTSNATRWLRVYRRAHMDESKEKMSEAVAEYGVFDGIIDILGELSHIVEVGDYYTDGDNFIVEIGKSSSNIEALEEAFDSYCEQAGLVYDKESTPAVLTYTFMEDWENFDADTYEKYVRLCQHDEMEPYSEEEWRRITGITKEMEESVTLEVYDADGKMIDRQPGFANSAEARDFADWNEDQYPAVHKVVIKYNEAVEEGSDNEFVLNTLEGDLKMLGFHLENQGATLAYPEYFGEGRDGYMFAERNCNPFLWAVVDVSARPKFCVDIMETDNELQQTEDLDSRCGLSYEEMLNYIKSFTEEETYEEKLTSRLNLINNKLAEAEEGFEEEKLYTGHSVEDIANQLEEEGYVVDTIFGKWIMFSDDDHNKYEAEVTKYYGGEYELNSANIALVPAEEEMDAEYDFDEVDEAENEEGWTEDYKWDGFEDKDFGMRDEWLADAPELEIPEEEFDDVDLRARNEVEAEMYDEKIQESAALREAVTFKAHHEEFLKKIRG